MSTSSDFKLVGRKAREVFCNFLRGICFSGFLFWVGDKRIVVEFEVQECMEGEMKGSYFSMEKVEVGNAGTNINEFKRENKI